MVYCSLALCPGPAAPGTRNAVTSLKGRAATLTFSFTEFHSSRLQPIMSKLDAHSYFVCIDRQETVYRDENSCIPQLIFTRTSNTTPSRTSTTPIGGYALRPDPAKHTIYSFLGWGTPLRWDKGSQAGDEIDPDFVFDGVRVLSLGRGWGVPRSIADPGQE
jgi:hypothetical protein